MNKPHLPAVGRENTEESIQNYQSAMQNYQFAKNHFKLLTVRLSSPKTANFALYIVSLSP